MQLAAHSSSAHAAAIASGAADAHIETSGSVELQSSFTGSHVLSSTQPEMFENLRHAA